MVRECTILVYIGVQYMVRECTQYMVRECTQYMVGECTKYMVRECTLLVYILA